MNVASEKAHPGSSTDSSTDASVAADRQALAAAFRLAERFGFSEGICNHFSVRLDGSAERYLINPYGLHWSEIQPESLLLIDGEGTVLEGVGEVEDTARFIHVAGHRANPRHKALLHTHMPYATTLTLLGPEHGRLTMVHQGALRFHGRTYYVDHYGGLALDEAEGERLAEAARRAPEVDITFLAHHGVVVGGRSVAQAFDDLYYLERASRQQVLAMQTGCALTTVSPEVIEQTAEQFGRDSAAMAEKHFDALCRVLAAQPNWVPVL